jgi:hypothetical protein
VLAPGVVLLPRVAVQLEAGGPSAVAGLSSLWRF